MAKKVTTLDEEPVEVVSEEPKEEHLSERKSGMISIQKYLQLHGSEIHMYTRAGLTERFRGIMKSKKGWDMEINKSMEGDK
jgi:hypothetical protein